MNCIYIYNNEKYASYDDLVQQIKSEIKNKKKLSGWKDAHAVRFDKDNIINILGSLESNVKSNNNVSYDSVDDHYESIVKEDFTTTNTYVGGLNFIKTHIQKLNFDLNKYKTNQYDYLIKKLSKKTTEAEQIISDEVQSWGPLRVYGTILHAVVLDILQNNFKSESDIATIERNLKNNSSVRGDIKSYVKEYNNSNPDNIITDENINKLFELDRDTFTRLLVSINDFRKNNSNINWDKNNIFTEVVVTSNNEISDTDQRHIKSKVDLIIYEKAANKNSRPKVHIIELKISRSNMPSWDAEKKILISNQLYLYKRLLAQKGINQSDIETHVMYLNISGFGKSNTSSPNDPPIWTINDATSTTQLSNSWVKNEMASFETDPNYISAINRMLPVDNEISKSSVDFIKNASDNFTKMIPSLEFNSYKSIENQLRSDPSYSRTADGKYQFIPKRVFGQMDFESVVIANTFEELVKKYEEYAKIYNDTKHVIAGNVKNSIRVFLENNEATSIFNDVYSTSVEQESYLKMEFNLSNIKINRREWKIWESDELLKQGIILLYNDITQEVEFVLIDNLNLSEEIKLKNGETHITADFERQKDVEYPDKLVSSTIVNLDYLKLMTIANELLPEILPEYKISTLKVFNPIMDQYYRTTFDLKKLDFSFSQLSHFSNSKLMDVKWTDAVDSVLNLLNDLDTYSVGGLKVDNKVWKNRDIDSKQKIVILRSIFDELYTSATTKSVVLTSAEQYVLLRVGELISYEDKVSVDLIDGKRYEKINGIKNQFQKRTLLNTAYSNTIDTNPAVKSIAAALRNVTTNVVHKLQNYKKEDRKHTQKLYDEHSALVRSIGTTGLSERFIDKKSDVGIAYFLYKNPYDNNSDLSETEKEYLKYYLSDLNKYRYGVSDFDSFNENNAQDGDDLNMIKWLAIPLVRASLTSKVMNGGLKKMLTFHSVVEDDFEGNTDRSLDFTRHYKDPGEFIQLNHMRNAFSTSDNWDSRMEQINLNRDKLYTVFETNLEQIKDLYYFNKIRKEGFDKIIPSINATLLVIQLSSHLSKEEAKETITFIYDYIRSGIFGESLIENDRELWKVLSTVKNIASKAILGFNALSGLKETTVGFFNLYTRATANMAVNVLFGDKDRPGLKHISEAYALVWRDSVKQVSTITLMEYLNAQYQMANMDLSQIVERINYDTAEFGRLNHKTYWFNMAPDFLHRMTILISYMKKDGSFGAHELVDGEVIYSWEKDKRFSLLTEYDPTSKEWQQQRAMYNALIDQLIEEDYEVLDSTTGEYRKLSNEVDPTTKIYKERLPKAYTSIQAASIRQESNGLFGYMDNDTKALYLKKGLWVLIHQFKTFLPAKKNQYFLSPGEHDVGDFVHYVENGKKMYWDREYGSDNRVISQKMVEHDTGEPVIVWKGKTMEGIFWSLIDLFKLTDPKTMKDAWNDPVKVRNFIIFTEELFTILFMTFIISWLFGEKQKNNEMTPMDKNVMNVLKAARSEFVILSIGWEALEFRVPLIEWLRKLGEGCWDMAFNDVGSLEFLSKTTGALRVARPYIMERKAEQRLEKAK